MKLKKITTSLIAAGVMLVTPFALVGCGGGDNKNIVDVSGDYTTATDMAQVQEYIDNADTVSSDVKGFDFRMFLNPIAENAEAEIEYNGTLDITTGDFLFSVSQEVVASTGETDSFYANVYYDRDLNNWYQETDGTYISMGEANGNVEMVAALVSQSFVTGLLSSATEASQFAIDENEDGTKIKVTTTTPSDSNVTLEFYVLFDASKNFSAFSLETEASNLGYGTEGSGSILVEFKTSTEGVTAPTNIA